MARIVSHARALSWQQHTLNGLPRASWRTAAEFALTPKTVKTVNSLKTHNPDIGFRQVSNACKA